MATSSGPPRAWQAMARIGEERTQTANEARSSSEATALQSFLHLAFDGGAPEVAGLRWSLAGVQAVVVGRGPGTSAREVIDGQSQLAIARDDPQISREHLRLERDGTRFVAIDVGSRNGTRLDGRRLSPGVRHPLRDRAVIAVGRTVFLYREAPPLPRAPAVVSAGELRPPHPLLATFSTAATRDFARLVKVVERLAPPVLLRGPTGSGKEVVARAIHDLLDRDGPFVAVNCAAIPANLVEAELFGARRGAYSGAEHREGLIRAAQGGTLFLDEVADLRPESQAALLRVLETREVLAVGATEPVAVDFALISATHRPLEAMIEAGELRPDLYARLAAFELTIPSLAERIEDLGLLVARFLDDMGTSHARFTGEAGEALARHPWPLNVRELKAAVQTAAALAGNEPIDLADLPEAIRRTTTGETSREGPGEGLSGAVQTVAVASAPRDDRLRAQLVELLTRHRGNVAAIGREVGKHRRQIHRWLDRLGLDPDDFRAN